MTNNPFDVELAHRARQFDQRPVRTNQVRVGVDDHTIDDGGQVGDGAMVLTPPPPILNAIVSTKPALGLRRESPAEANRRHCQRCSSR
jgi:hypothetical protein